VNKRSRYGRDLVILEMALKIPDEFIAEDQHVKYVENMVNLGYLRAKCGGSNYVPLTLFNKPAMDVITFLDTPANRQARSLMFHPVFIFSKMMLRSARRQESGYKNDYHDNQFVSSDLLVKKTRVGFLGWYTKFGNNFTFVSGLVNGQIMYLGA